MERATGWLMMIGLALTLVGCGGCPGGTGGSSSTSSSGGSPTDAGGLALNEACTGGGCQAGLQCLDGTCQRADCLSGTLNCPCAANNACADDGVACVEGNCRLTGCTPGSPGCACDMGQCQGGECVAGFCTTPTGEGVRVLNASARSCEVTLDDPDHVVLAVTFGSTVEGRSAREGRHLAMAFLAREDAAIVDGAVQLQRRPNADASNLTVLRGVCADRAGETLSGSVLALEE